DARLRRRAHQAGQAHRRRAAPVDGPGHAEGPAHGDRISQRPGGARGREAWAAVPRQRRADRYRQTRGARRVEARSTAHHGAAAELSGRRRNHAPLASVLQESRKGTSIEVSLRFIWGIPVQAAAGRQRSTARGGTMIFARALAAALLAASILASGAASAQTYP